PWQLVAKRTGAVTKVIELTPDGRLDVSRLEDVITPRTRVVAFTHLSNVTGAVTEIAPIIAAARAVGAIVVMDTCQSSAHLPLDVDGLGVDFACFSAHKMLGPTGVGALWGRRELLEQLPVFLSGGSMIENVTVEETTFLPAPYRFEAGTQPVAQIVGWAAACQYLQELGMERVAAHEQALTAYALPRLVEIPGVKLLGPNNMTQRAGVLSFEMKGIHPHDLGQYLDSQGVAVRVGHHCAIPLHRFFGVNASTRVTFSPTTTIDEIDRWLQALPQAAKFFGVTTADS
uniref:aminotransferase class V-fold PLP-dependent enzyme n=1 Tax=uncultured Mobiluncus sp. TaxID=293425 RepID=UPI0026353790